MTVSIIKAIAASVVLVLPCAAVQDHPCAKLTEHNFSKPEVGVHVSSLQARRGQGCRAQDPSQKRARTVVCLIRGEYRCFNNWKRGLGYVKVSV